MTPSAGCLKPLLIGLAIAANLLSACATGGSDGRAPCPPIVDYTSAERERAAGEVEALPEDSMIVRMLSDYVVLRDQVRACQQNNRVG